MDVDVVERPSVIARPKIFTMILEGSMVLYLGRLLQKLSDI